MEIPRGGGGGGAICPAWKFAHVEVMGGTFIVIGGPAGTGKTTVAELLSSELKCPYLEGDEFHPRENIDKMSSGLALTDDDRWGWLRVLSKTTSDKVMDPENESKAAIVSCSMLKKIYREYIKQEAHDSDQIRFVFVFLYSTFEELLKRVGNREAHYMKSDMVKSQYDIMEIPRDEELILNRGNSLAVDTTNKSPREICHEIVPYLV